MSKPETAIDVSECVYVHSDRDIVPTVRVVPDGVRGTLVPHGDEDSFELQGAHRPDGVIGTLVMPSLVCADVAPRRLFEQVAGGTYEEGQVVAVEP